MSGQIAARLNDLGIVLPAPPPAAGAYVPFVITDNLVYVAGQLPMDNGALLYTGRLGDTIGVEEGALAAQLCAINLLSHLQAACAGDLDRVRRVVRLGGFVAASADFTEHPRVVNGASELMVAVFGESGRHARAAVGCVSLPLGACVEVDGVFEIDRELPAGVEIA